MYVEHVDLIEFLNTETFEEFSWSYSLFFWLVLIDLEVHNCLYACIRDDKFFFFLFVLSQSQIWLR